MTQIIVTLEDNSPINLIKKAISLLKGVTRVVVQTSSEQVVAENDELEGINQEIRSLIGIATNIKTDEIVSDEKLSYILGK